MLTLVILQLFWRETLKKCPCESTSQIFCFILVFIISSMSSRPRKGPTEMENHARQPNRYPDLLLLGLHLIRSLSGLSDYNGQSPRRL
jgi:hypothetical protein